MLSLPQVVGWLSIRKKVDLEVAFGGRGGNQTNGQGIMGLKSSPRSKRDLEDGDP